MKEEMGFEDDGKSGNQRWSTSAVITIGLAIIIVLVPLCTCLTYFLHPGYPPNNGNDSFEPLPVEPDVRINCIPDRDESASEELCESRGCTWMAPYSEGQPWCFFPEDYGPYHVTVMDDLSWGMRIRVERDNMKPSFFNSDINTLVIDIEHQTNDRIHFKIYDPSEARFEVPVAMPPRPETKAENPNYEVTYTTNPFTLKITRRSTGQVLWDTSIGALIFEDQFLSISTRLPSTNIYGLGESEHHSFRHDMNWITWGVFSRDQPPSYKGNLYGVHPFYMCVENDANAHGVLLLNANAQDFALQPTPALTYHTIGGILDFYMFLGPNPEDVVGQYTEAIGRPAVPPYWALGYQLCRYGYGNLSNVQEVVESMRQYQIPHDVQYGDIDYMNRQLDFTIHPTNYVGLGDWVDTLKQDGTRYIIILDPAISANETEANYPTYTRGVQEDVFIKDENGDIQFGKVWPDYPDVVVDPSLPWEEQVEKFRAYAAFPDFRKQSAQEWWRNEMEIFYNDIKFDGIWIDMNEPASFVHGSVDGCPINDYDNPPFLPQIWGPTIYDKTLCMNSIQQVTDGMQTTHYNMHSLYGWSQTQPTLDAAESITQSRSLVISRSTFPSSGRHTGHWLGDNASIWPHLYYSIIGMLEFNLFGIPYIGADICGFFNDSPEELCRRWHQVGAFYPYSRNHNGLGYQPQHPAYYGEEFALEVRDVLHIRYTLLPYLYTLFYHAHTRGSTVVRPMMHEFTSDSNTWDIDRQFLWGPALLISPVLEPQTTIVMAYFPTARWYDYYTGMEISSDMLAVGGGVELDAPMDYINLHVRGGYIIPTQTPDNSTMFSRRNDFGLIIALDDEMAAAGDLFWDDDEAIGTIENDQYYMFHYTFSNNMLTAEIANSYSTLMDNLVMGHVMIYGLTEAPSRVVLTDYNQVTETTFTVDQETMAVNVTGLNHAMDTGFTLTILYTEG